MLWCHLVERSSVGGVSVSRKGRPFYGLRRKKRQIDHVLRAAEQITGEKQFVIIGSQSLHGK